MIIKEPLIIETILVPAILNQFHSTDHIEVTKAISAISRLGVLASRSEAPHLLLDLLKHSNMNKNLVAGALRSLGDKGGEILAKIVSSIKSPKILSIICFYLGCKIPDDYCSNVFISLYSSDIGDQSLEFKRGAICRFEGNLTAPLFDQKKNDPQESYQNLT